MIRVLIGSSNVEAGGETIFPSANVNKSVVIHKKDDLSECGQSGLAVKPRRGDALLFWSMRPDTSVDPSSLHGKIEGATLQHLFSCFICFIAIYLSSHPCLIWLIPFCIFDYIFFTASCPVIHGNKWSATKWMHVNEYKV